MLEQNEAANGAGKTAPFTAATMLNNVAANAFTQASQTFGHFCSDWQHEVGNFISNRAKADLELSSTLVHCHNLVDLVSAQHTWLATATAEYAHEGRRLAELSATAVRDGMMSWLATLQSATTQAARPEAVSKEI